MSKKSDFPFNLRITFNAPVTLSFSIAAVLIMALNMLFKNQLIPALFTVSGNAKSAVPFDFHQPVEYFRIIFHVLGHADWNHLISNLAFILLLGPLIEDKYGSAVLAVMMSVTSLVTGVLNVCFSPVIMCGSSDIAFMMILLASFTSISKNEIPLSFILILFLYLGREILGHDASQNISTLAHIAGGLCGSLFAFLATPVSQKKSGSTKKASSKNKKSGGKSYEETIEELDAASPRFKKQNNDDDDATVVGSIEL